ncbi:MAG: hypothetical protein WCB57_15535 [Pseudonocardiaceae bacterium]
MKHTTVKVPDDVDRAMRDEANRREMTLSEWAPGTRAELLFLGDLASGALALSG